MHTEYMMCFELEAFSVAGTLTTQAQGTLHRHCLMVNGHYGRSREGLYNVIHRLNAIKVRESNSSDFNVSICWSWMQSIYT